MARTSVGVLKMDLESAFGAVMGVCSVKCASSGWEYDRDRIRT